MITLRIEHGIANFAAWKQAFDSDPINRKQSGVKRFRVYRPIDDDEHHVAIELDFETQEQALGVQTALNRMFGNIEGQLIFGPTTTILSIAEEREL